MFTNTKKENSAEEISNASNIIGQGTTVEGNLKTIGNIRVEGKAIGGITTKAKVVLGNSAKVKGNIVAQNAAVGGEVEGTLEVSELLTLKSTAVVKGDIITNKLVFEEGAQFNGKCKMGTSMKETSLEPASSLPQENGKSIEKSPQ
ncbi:MAG: polymer-forming cytoskeletal protein [Cytophagales bacterium]|nr:polymer-forming cytoskeletal protein [Cytophagales bacterium]